MANLLAQGLAWLDQQLEEHASSDVVYRRGALSVTIAAQLGEQLLKVSDRQGNTKVMRTELDVLVSAADLILDGSVVTPDRGDTVDITFGSVTKRFGVMPPQGDEAMWRYADPHQNRLRIHCKFKSKV